MSDVEIGERIGGVDKQGLGRRNLKLYRSVSSQRQNNKLIRFFPSFLKDFEKNHGGVQGVQAERDAEY